MPSADAPLNEDNIAEAIQQIKDAPTNKKADLAQVFALRLDNVDTLSPTSLDATTLLLPLLHQTSLSSPTILTPLLLSLIPSQITLLKRLDDSPNKERLRLMVQVVMPVLVERLSDAKERVQGPAVECLISLGVAIFSDSGNSKAPSAISDLSSTHSSTSTSTTHKSKSSEPTPQLYERSLLTPMADTKNPRTKVGAMKVVVGLRLKTAGGAGGAGAGFALKGVLPILVGYLEDGDSGVREGARNALVTLLSAPNTPLPARSELKKIMTSRQLKSTLIDSLLDQINKAASSTASSANSRLSAGSAIGGGAGVGGGKGRAVSGKSVGALEEVEIAPVYIATERELEAEFASYEPAFEGKETEHNWTLREKAIISVRGMLITGVHKQFHGAFMGVLKGGFLLASTKTLASLRTTLAIMTTEFYNDLIRELTTSLDPLIDILLLHLAKLSGATKKLTAEASQNVISNIIKSATCPAKQFIPFLSHGVYDKAPQVRGYFGRHLKEYLMEKVGPGGGAGGKAVVLSPEQVAAVGEMIKHLIGDVTPAVREMARQTYWVYQGRYPKEAGALLNGLDEPARKQLEKVKPAEKPLQAEVQAQKTNGSAPAAQSTAKAPVATVSAPATKEKKPVSSTMAEIRKRKMQMMKAQQAAAGGPQDELLPETVPPSPVKAAISPAKPVEAPVSLHEGHVSNVEGVPVKSPPRSPVRGKEEEGLPRSPALLDFDTSVRRPAPAHPRKDLHQSPLMPMKNPGRDVFDSPERPIPTQPVLSAARIGELQAATELSAEEVPLPVSPKAAGRLPVAKANGQTDILPPQNIALPRSPPNAASSSSGATDAILTPPQPSSSSKPSQPHPASTKWDPASESFRTPPFTDCSIWVNAARSVERLNEETRRVLREELLGARLMTASRALSHKWFTYLTDEAEGAGRVLKGVTDTDGIRYLAESSQMDSGTLDGELETRLGDLVENILPLLSENQDAKFGEQVIVLLWEAVVRHRSALLTTEAAITSLLFELYLSTDNRISRGAAALLAIMGQTTSTPVDFLHILLKEIDRRSAAANANKSTFLGLVSAIMLILRLPRAVLEEQIDRIQPEIMRGIQASHVAVRQAANMAIVAIQANIRSRSTVFSYLPALTDQQKDLVVYIMEKSLPGGGEDVSDKQQGDGQLSRELRRLSTMRVA